LKILTEIIEEDPVHKALREEDLIGFVNSDDEVPGSTVYIKKEKEPKKSKKKEVITCQPAPPISDAEQKIIDEIYK
jgi:hypothetical protein